MHFLKHNRLLPCNLGIYIINIEASTHYPLILVQILAEAEFGNCLVDRRFIKEIADISLPSSGALNDFLHKENTVAVLQAGEIFAFQLRFGTQNLVDALIVIGKEITIRVIAQLSQYGFYLVPVLRCIFRRIDSRYGCFRQFEVFTQLGLFLIK